MSFNHDQEVFPEAEQQLIANWVNNDEMPDLIEAAEPDEETICENYCCNRIIECVSVVGGFLLGGLAGYWAWDEEFGNPMMDFWHMFPTI